MSLFKTIMGAVANANNHFDPDDYDWYCDECDASLNDQPGFTTQYGEWKCTKCGCVNYIDQYAVIDSEEDDEDSESLSVYDAAEIWLSNGKDEDYMFGYSEEELEDAL